MSAIKGMNAALSEARLLGGHKGSVNIAAFNADGNYCLSAGDDRRILLWNPRRETDADVPIKLYTGHNERVLGLCVAHDNASFASCGGDRSVFVWDVPSGRVLRRLSGHSQRVNAVAYAGDSCSVLVSASYDTSARCWDLRSRSTAPIQVLGGSADSLTALAVSEHEVMTSSVDGVVRTYDLRAGAMISDTVGAAITNLALSRDGHCILTASLDARLRLLDKATGGLLNTYKGHAHTQFKLGMCLSHDDAFVLGGSEDGFLHVWDLVEATLIARLPAAHGAVTTVACDPRRLEVLTGGHDGSVKFWTTPMA
jgi:mitogen-activated protein kinase organizer 1